MLVLSRKLNETICIGQDIQVKIVRIRGSVVGLGITAPEKVKVMRQELLERDKQSSIDSTINSQKSLETKQFSAPSRWSSELRSMNGGSTAPGITGVRSTDIDSAPEAMKMSTIGQGLLHVAS